MKKIIFAILGAVLIASCGDESGAVKTFLTEHYGIMNPEILELGEAKEVAFPLTAISDGRSKVLNMRIAVTNAKSDALCASSVKEAKALLEAKYAELKDSIYVLDQEMLKVREVMEIPGAASDVEGMETRKARIVKYMTPGGAKSDVLFYERDGVRIACGTGDVAEFYALYMEWRNNLQTEFLSIQDEIDAYTKGYKRPLGRR